MKLISDITKDLNNPNVHAWVCEVLLNGDDLIWEFYIRKDSIETLAVWEYGEDVEDDTNESDIELVEGALLKQASKQGLL